MARTTKTFIRARFVTGGETLIDVSKGSRDLFVSLATKKNKLAENYSRLCRMCGKEIAGVITEDENTMRIFFKDASLSLLIPREAKLKVRYE